METNFKIFAYGSLLFKESLLKTVPTAQNIFPCKLYGFVRNFNFPSPYRMSEIDGIPCAVLNIEETDTNKSINGICFDLNSENFEELKFRERGYELIEVKVKDYYDEFKITKAYLFKASNYESHTYQINSKKQKEYLDWCYLGCNEFGNLFLKEFKETTFIDNKSLDELNL
jgi:cation transport regulator ChaC